MSIGEQINFKDRFGKEFFVKLTAIGHVNDDGYRRVFFEVNGQQNSFDILDRCSDEAAAVNSREKADPNNQSQVGCMMNGLIVDVVKNVGDQVSEGDPIAVLSAMKMETIISASKSGKISKILVKQGDAVDSQDLIAEIE